MMKISLSAGRFVSVCMCLSLAAIVGCDGAPILIPDGILDDLPDDISDIVPDICDFIDCPDGGIDSVVDRVTLRTYATNTGEASGMAWRPSDGAVFIVSKDGLFGPINDGDDVSTLTPLGATNLGDADLFDAPPDTVVLGISNAGEFWIASPGQTTAGVVPPEGGDAVQFLGLFDAQELAPETIALVPDGFTGPQFTPGSLLFGQETTFSRLAQLDADGDESVILIDNPTPETNRQAHHLTFGLDGGLYSSRGTSSLLTAGVQSIATNGTPTNIVGTTGLAPDSFVVLANGDIVMRGSWKPNAAVATIRGVLIYDVSEDAILIGTNLATDEITEGDEMIISPDGSMILLSLPARNEIVVVTVDGSL